MAGTPEELSSEPFMAVQRWLPDLRVAGCRDPAGTGAGASSGQDLGPRATRLHPMVAHPRSGVLAIQRPAGDCGGGPGSCTRYPTSSPGSTRSSCWAAMIPGKHRPHHQLLPIPGQGQGEEDGVPVPGEEVGVRCALSCASGPERACAPRPPGPFFPRPNHGERTFERSWDKLLEIKP